MHVRVTLAGAVGTPTGTIIGSTYGNAGCTGTPVRQSGPGILDGPTFDLTAFTYKAVASGNDGLVRFTTNRDVVRRRIGRLTSIRSSK